MDLSGFQCFFQRHGWQDGRQAFGQHGFPGTRWANHDDIVSASCSNLQRPFYVLLSFHIGEIHNVIMMFLKQRLNIHVEGFDFGVVV